MGLGYSAYLSGDLPKARKSAEEALAAIAEGQDLWRIGALYVLSLVATDEGRGDEGESLASEGDASPTASVCRACPRPRGLRLRWATRSRAEESWTRPRRRWKTSSPPDRKYPTSAPGHPPGTAGARQGPLGAGRPKRRQNTSRRGAQDRRILPRRRHLPRPAPTPGRELGRKRQKATTTMESSPRGSSRFYASSTASSPTGK